MVAVAGKSTYWRPVSYTHLDVYKRQIQNGTARKLAVPDLTTTVLTLTITGTAFESRLGGGANSRLGRRGLSIFAMFAGAMVGTLLVLHVHVALPLLVAVVLLVPVAAAAARLSRSKPAWDLAP